MSGRKNKKKYNNNNTNSSPAADVYKGRLEVTRTGMGFVIVEGLERDIMIRPEKLGNALDGDEVMVTVAGGGKNPGRMQGEIKDVLGRKQNDFSGKLEVHTHFAFVVPDKKNMPVDIFVPLHLLKEGKNGDKVIVKIVEWSGRSKNPVGEIVSVLTNETFNEIAMQGILVESGFPLHFPDEVMEEAESIAEGITSEEEKKRKDLRGVLTITIDPVDAKDFDDAISFRKLKGGNMEIGVHIADVGHFMQPGTALDKEAYRRATSVYLPDRVLPMLPERLSNGLCSLRPDEDKYTFSAIFEITKAGKIKDYWLGRTITRSQRRFAYEDVQEILEGKDGDHKDVLLQINKIARILREERFKKGAINFSSQEVRFKLDEKGVPIGIVIKESKEAHQLIEELMLLANKTVAEHVAKMKVKDKPVPFAYRVHDVPDEEKLKMFTTFASRYGYRFDLNTPESIARSFNEMLQLVKGKPEQHVLESLGIRTMSKAVYTTENIGHYGLGFEHYCHFTSPIRRYPDVMVHRVLQEVLDDNVHPAANMEQQCRHCSDQERRAMEAERTANKYKQVEYMLNYVGEDFEAVVSGVASFGFWAETVEHKCEGMISITDLSSFDDFQLMEQEYALIGRNTGIRFRMGDRIKVRVVNANLEKRQIDYTILELPENEQAKMTKAQGTGFVPQQRKPYDHAARKPYPKPQQGSGKPYQNNRPKPQTVNPVVADQPAEQTAAAASEKPQQGKNKNQQKGRKSPSGNTAPVEKPVEQPALPIQETLQQEKGKKKPFAKKETIANATPAAAPTAVAATPAPAPEAAKPIKGKGRAKAQNTPVANAAPEVKPAAAIAPVAMEYVPAAKGKKQSKTQKATATSTIPVVPETKPIAETAPVAPETAQPAKNKKQPKAPKAPVTNTAATVTPVAEPAPATQEKTVQPKGKKQTKAQPSAVETAVVPAPPATVPEAPAAAQPAKSKKASGGKKKKTTEE